MGDSVLWFVALGAGAIGLVLLAVAVAAAIYVNIKTHGAEGGTSADEPQSESETADSTNESEGHASSSDSEQASIGGFWAWVKAWIFAVVHAGTVSLVVGGITFFEDLSKAGEEIERTGTVTFPKQLLPGPLSGSVSRKRLARPSNDVGNPEQSDTPSKDTAGWEVVDLLEETDAGSSS